MLCVFLVFSTVSRAFPMASCFPALGLVESPWAAFCWWLYWQLSSPRASFSTPVKPPCREQCTCRAETRVKKTDTAMPQLGTFLPPISHIAQVRLKHKPPIKKSLEIIYCFMIAKYGNIIPLMEAQINGICCKVSMNGFMNLNSYVTHWYQSWLQQMPWGHRRAYIEF